MANQSLLAVFKGLAPAETPHPILTGCYGRSTNKLHMWPAAQTRYLHIEIKDGI